MEGYNNEQRREALLDPPLSLFTAGKTRASAAMSVILTTYNQPRYLELALAAWDKQSYSDFELIIADDGSTEETRRVVCTARDRCSFPIKHIWQPDEGFRKCRALNLAVLASSSPYLVFSDGDCLPQTDFLQWHNHFRSPGSYLSGGYIKLSAQVSAQIDMPAIFSGSFCRRKWLRRQGLRPLENFAKLSSGPVVAPILNRLSRTRAGWHGHNASCWRSDALAVGGFDERMAWGGEDLEFGYRLVNAGLKARRIRYSAICVHLYHRRPWKNAAALRLNDALRTDTRRTGKYYTSYGIQRHLDQALNGVMT